MTAENISTPLQRDLVAAPSLWRLTLRLEPGRRLSALLLGPESADRSVIYHSEELPDPSVKALENAVYDSPLLLADFAATTIVYSTPQFFAAPAGLDPALTEEMARAMLPDFDAPRRVLASPFPGGEIVYAVEADTCNFMARTFATARTLHSLAADATWLAHRNAAAGDSSHLFALCEGPGEMALVGFNNAGALRFLNRPQPQEPTDCAYFALAARSGAEPLSVGGQPDWRNGVCEALRRADPAARVLPLTLPNDLLHLRRLAPEAPSDLLFLTQI